MASTKRIMSHTQQIFSYSSVNTPPCKSNLLININPVETTPLITDENNKSIKTTNHYIRTIPMLIATVAILCTIFSAFKAFIIDPITDTRDYNNINCTNSYVACNTHGICVSNHPEVGCQCDYGYTTFNSQDSTMCNYKQKSQLTAFLLSVFLGGVGAGRFYVGDIGSGVVLLSLIIVGCCYGCFAIVQTSDNDLYSYLIVGEGVIPACLCANVLWVVIDSVLFAVNKIPDENGVQLAPW
eukprot:98185_1